MKVAKLMVVLSVVMLLAALTAGTTYADGEPAGSCPDDFHMHSLTDHQHSGDGQHHHVGNDEDLNGDGFICGKHVGKGGSVHVHVDNNVPADNS